MGRRPHRSSRVRAQSRASASGTCHLRTLTGLVLRAVRPVIDHIALVLQVVTGDRLHRVRRRPRNLHPARCLARRHSRGLRLRRPLIVRQRDRHLDAVREAAGVPRRHRHIVESLRLEIVGHTRLRVQWSPFSRRLRAVQVVVRVRGGELRHGIERGGGGADCERHVLSLCNPSWLGLRSFRSLPPSHDAWAEPTGERHIRTDVLPRGVQFSIAIDKARGWT